MPFCSNCGVKTQEPVNFCSSCGTRQTGQQTSGNPTQQVQEQKSLITSGEWNMLRKPNIIIGLIIIECIAILGALPIIGHKEYTLSDLFGYTHSYKYSSFWEDFWPVTIIFFAFVFLIVLNITWQKPSKVKAVSEVLVFILLMLTILSVQSLKIMG